MSSSEDLSSLRGDMHQFNQHLYSLQHCPPFKWFISDFNRCLLETVFYPEEGSLTKMLFLVNWQMFTTVSGSRPHSWPPTSRTAVLRCRKGKFSKKRQGDVYMSSTSLNLALNPNLTAFKIVILNQRKYWMILYIYLNIENELIDFEIILRDKRIYMTFF